MRKHLTLVAAILFAAWMGTGCKQTPSFEIATEAFRGNKDRAEVDRKLSEALSRADEQIKEDPKALRPYVVKGSVYFIKKKYDAAVDAFQAGLANAEIKNENLRARVNEYVITAYFRSNEVMMLKAGIDFVKKLISSEGEKEYYAYSLGCFNLALYHKLGDGFYKSEANRNFQSVDLDAEPEIAKELSKEGIPDPLLE